MDLKVFFSTFILIFLAELGDKTQLTALAFSSNSKSVWPVFFGASFALVCSTMLACLFGSFLKNQSFVSMNLIKGVSGALFIVFGLVILINLFRPSSEEVSKYEAVTEGIPSDLISRVVLKAAANLEKESIQHYREAVSLIRNQSVRDAVEKIINEEEKHQEYFFQHDMYGEVKESIAFPLVDICHSAKSCRARQILSGLISHEKEAALFYSSLAKNINFKSVRNLLKKVADEEKNHALILEKLLAENENLQ